MKFEVIGKPQGKGRPRFSSRGNFVKTYTPQKTANYENWIKTCFLNQCKNFDSSYDGAVKVKIEAIYSVPKSYSKKKRAELLDFQMPYLHKPDVDNIAKCVCDALNGIAYKDDSQVSLLFIDKKYGLEDKLIVEIEYMDMKV